MPRHRFSPCRFLPLTVASAALSTSLVVPSVWAQETGWSIQRGRTPQTFSQPASLGEALQTLPFNWDASEKGVLLYVMVSYAAEPARLRKTTFELRQRSDILQPGPNGYRLQDIAAHYDRNVLSAGTVTTLAPTMTTVLATRLPKPDLYADLGTSEKLRRLESTLSPAQWRLLASPTGLGEGDLKSGAKILLVIASS